MRAVLMGALLLAGCAPMSKAEEANDLADAAQANARTALGRIEELDSRISDLEEENRRLKESLRLTDASLTEARENHTSLLNTLNSNVDKSNRREAAQESDIDWLLRRSGVSR